MLIIEILASLVTQLDYSSRRANLANYTSFGVLHFLPKQAMPLSEEDEQKPLPTAAKTQPPPKCPPPPPPPDREDKAWGVQAWEPCEQPSSSASGPDRNSGPTNGWRLQPLEGWPDRNSCWWKGVRYNRWKWSPDQTTPADHQGWDEPRDAASENSEARNSQAARAASASNDGPTTLPWSQLRLRLLEVDFFLGAQAIAHHRQHSAALKYFRANLRAITENTSWTMYLPDVMDVCAINHFDGPNYEVDYNRTGFWSWLDLVKQLRDDDIKFVVNGQDGQGGGLTGCSFSPRPNSYDHKSHHKLKKAGVRPELQSLLPTYDFVLHRVDGTSIRLHPSWRGGKVESYDGAGHLEPVPPPKPGLGASEGPGTFKRYKDLGNDRTLHFDPLKCEALHG